MNVSYDWRRELRHSWPMLRPDRSELAATALPLEFQSVQVRLGVDSKGCRHLLIPITTEDDPKPDTVDGSLLVLLRTYAFGSASGPYVDIVCNRSELFDLFDDVLIDVLAELEAAAEKPCEVAIAVVSRWRSLLATRRQPLLTLTGQMSLIAELHVLDLSRAGRPLDISTWRGPLREPHDIVLDRCALEVKAIGATSHSIEIHGEHQLEPPGKPLALVVVRVTESVDGETLPDVVGRVTVTSPDQSEVLKRLSAAGYTPADGPRYVERFTVHSIEFVEVDGSVPRIVPASFAAGMTPVGVEHLTYQLMLDSLDPLLVRGESSLVQWIHGRAE